MLEYWKQHDIFQKSVENRDPKNEFVFFDGPPFATGTPHYGHILAGALKDAIPRYQTMKGKRVERRFGWDCHGVPVEFQVEKEQNIGGKPGIEAMGVGKFNEMCRGIVMRCADEWETTVARMGRFVDFKNSYKTMDLPYMESVWSVFKALWEKGLIYEGEKVIAYSPKLGSPLSNFEANLNYKDINDPAVTVKFRVKEMENTYFLAWTTTPWTLPSNLALCVNPEMEYVKVQVDIYKDEYGNFHYGIPLSYMENNSSKVLSSDKERSEYYICAKNLYEILFEKIQSLRVVETLKGSDLIGTQYEPLFPFFEEKKEEGAFRILGDSFVSDSDGTGIVHLAPTGEDDARILTREGISLVYPFNEICFFDFTGIEIAKEAEEDKKSLEGLYFRTDETVEGSKEKNANSWVLQELKKRGSLFKHEQIRHSYPHCWRTECALMYRGIKTWFVNVQKIKETMLQENENIEWIPEHLKHGRFGKILEGAPDWAISRNRYWGAPIPVWRCEVCGNTEVISTKEELEAKTGKSVTDIHKHFVDDLVWECEKCRDALQCVSTTETEKTGTMHRIPEVLDCWFESGAMPYASRGIHFQKTNLSPLEAPIKNITEIITTVKEENFWQTNTKRAVGTLPSLIAKELDLDETVYLSDRLYGKIRNWWQERHGHEEMQESDFYFLPVLLSHPAFVLLDTKSHDLVVILNTNEQSFVVILDNTNGYTEILSFFRIRKRKEQNEYLNNSKRYKKMTLEGLPNPSCIPESLREDLRRLVGRLSSRQGHQLRTDIIQFFEKIQILSPSSLQNIAMEKSKILPPEADFIVNKIVLHPVVSEEDWQQYHHIRKTEIFDVYYLGKEYLRDNPDDTNPKNTPMLFLLNGKAVGTTRLDKKGDALIIRTFAVLKELQRTGIGAKALEAIQQWAVSHGYKKLLLNANPAAIDFYTRNGFIEGLWEGDISRKDGHQALGKNIIDFYSFPIPQADFIAEGLDQTRGWFYTLHVLGCALFGKNIYKNVITNGIILAEDGQKMSKSKKNYPDPTEIFEKYGADAMRFYLLSSPAVKAENLKFSEKGVEEVLKTVLLPMWNTYSFFVTYANIDGWVPSVETKNFESLQNPLDQWILSRLQTVTQNITDRFDAFDVQGVREIISFLDELTNWYVRRSRRRFWKSENDVDKNDAYTVLHYVLVQVTKLLAPVCPFITDALFQNLTKKESVHLENWSSVEKIMQNTNLEKEMEITRSIVSLGLSLRAQEKIKVRQPLSIAQIALPSHILPESLEKSVIAEELNVKIVEFVQNQESIAEFKVFPNARLLGPKYGKEVQEIIKEAKLGNVVVHKNGQITVAEKWILFPEEMEVGYVGKEGAKVMSEKGVVVLLKTEITEELRIEGISRELIRNIQDFRKNSGFKISDRISLVFFTEFEDIQKAFEIFGNQIDEETLTEKRIQKNIPLVHGTTCEIDGTSLEMGITVLS